MRYIFSKTYLLFAGWVLLSCTKEVDIPIPNEAPKSVVSTYIVAGDSITVLAGLSEPFGDNVAPIIDSNATVNLYRNNQFLETLMAKEAFFFGSGDSFTYVYKSNHIAQDKGIYKIEVLRNKVPTATGVEVMPPAPLLNYFEPNEVNKQIKVKLESTSATAYYVFEAFAGDDPLNTLTMVCTDPRMQVYVFGVVYSSNTISGGTRFYLKNTSTDNRELAFSYVLEDSALTQANFKISQISESYYLHEISKGTQESVVPFFNEPTRLYTNINQGFGVVACAQEVLIPFNP